MSKDKATDYSETYNVVVIGAGTAGLVTAAATAGLGGRVALIERDKMGGDCLNFGCVPSKALIASSRRIHAIRDAEQHGLLRMEPQFDFERVFEHMRSRRARLAINDSQERFESLGVDVFRGQAQFVSPHEVRVGEVTLRAKNFVIATGSRALVPPVEGIDQVPYFTNSTIFDELKTKPKSIAILGGGPIGCELGQVFQRLGVQVTLIEAGPQLLSKEDPDVSDLVSKRLEAEGMRMLLGVTARAVACRNGEIEVALAASARAGEKNSVPSETISTDQLLIATGRAPNIEELGLDAIGVYYDKRGIKVNAYLQTSQRHIYAAGDVAGPYQFTHMADAQARVVARNILIPFLKAKINYSVVPWCTYIEPEVAHVGLNETEAQKSGVAYDCWVQPFDEVDRAVIADEEVGFAKILTVKGKDRIIGVTIVGQHAGELMHEFVVAMKFKISLRQLSQTIHAYPTLSEIARKVGDKYSRSLLSPRVKKVFSWLYRRARS